LAPVLADSRTWAGDNVPVGLSIPDPRQHLHLLGATGTGKSTAMLNLAVADIAAGRGIAVLDPKGDLVEGVLARIPASRKDDVILIGPDDLERSVGLNPLELGEGDDQELPARASPKPTVATSSCISTSSRTSWASPGRSATRSPRPGACGSH
jgi:hypothetical protein